MSESILNSFRARLGADGLIADPKALSQFLTEWRGDYFGKALCAVRPNSVEEVQFVVRACAKARIPLVPQGGNTGLCGGAIPDAEQVLVLMDRMDRIRSVDKINMSMTVDAGVNLKKAYETAAAADLFFPMRITPWEKSQVGGLISSNAGGLHTVYCGSMRSLVLGLEVVLSNGEVWNCMRALRKNNEGYDLKHLFIGAEGTLGIITGVALRLFPPLLEKKPVLFRLDSIGDVLEKLEVCRRWDNLLTFEAMNKVSVELLNKHKFTEMEAAEWTVLVEFKNFLPEEFKGNEASEKEAEEAHRGRLNLSLAQKAEGSGVKSDVSLRISDIKSFIEATNRKIREISDFRPVVFGHFAEGNIHYNPMEPEEGGGEFASRRSEIKKIIQEEVIRRGGSITGEHGIGKKHREFLLKERESDLIMMRKIKSLMDPTGSFNPGKVT